MKVFCFLVSVPSTAGGMSISAVARLALCEEEAENHPLRISEVREINIEPDPRRVEQQSIDIQQRPRADAA